MVQAPREGADGPVNHSVICPFMIMGDGVVRPHCSLQLCPCVHQHVPPAKQDFLGSFCQQQYHDCNNIRRRKKERESTLHKATYMC